MALVLICLLGSEIWSLPKLVPAAIVVLLLTMTWPRIFQPFAIFWFALSEVLGTVVSKIVLTLLFYVLLLPIGRVMSLVGKDSMRLKSWKKGNETVFRSREHTFAAKDLEYPY